MALMSDPSFQSLAQELMSDPQTMAEVMEAQRAFQSGDMSAMQRLQSSPTFARLASAMSSNPGFFQAMMSGGMGSGAGLGPQMPPPGMPQAPSQPANQNTGPPTPAAQLSAEEQEEAELQRAIQMSLDDAEGEQHREERDPNVN